MLINTQPIEKRVPSDGLELDVQSIFRTIQGEGPFCGTPSVFVRLAGCNLQCPSCDTDYTQGRQLTSPKAIVALIKQMQHDGLVVITGGEPFRQELQPLLALLVSAGYYVQIETNGTLEPTDFPFCTLPDIRTGVYVVCSPKAGKVHPKINEVACCFKYVLSHASVREEDGLPIKALNHSAHPFVARPPEDFHRPIYLQPMDAHSDEENALNLQAAIRSCMDYGYILQLQVHKILNME